MSERERSGSGSGDYDKPKVSAKVDIHGKTAGEFRVPQGSTLSDMITEIKRSVNLGELSQYTSVRVDDKDIEIRDGNLAENPTLTQNCTISFVRGAIAGGCR